MYLEPTITLWIEAVKELFDDEFPYPDMKDISVHTEYPLDPASYPGLWVQFQPTQDVHNVGIGHVEMSTNSEGEPIKAYRWKFDGLVEVTVAALSSLERVRMIDWLSKAIAFGLSEGTTPLSDFRKKIEQNDLIGQTVIWEAFTISGFAETPGTPWGTDDVIYEATVTLTVEGEYAFSPDTVGLVALSEIVISDQEQVGEDPLPPPPDLEGWR